MGAVSPQQLVLLDRDGVINVDCAHYVRTPDAVTLIPGSAAAIAALNAAHIPVAVVSNQAGVGRGYMTQADLDAVNTRIAQEVWQQSGGQIQAWYMCTDAPEVATNRRKPGCGMLMEAMAAFQAASTATVMIGDALRDLQAASAAGCGKILVRTGHGRATLRAQEIRAQHPFMVADDLYAAVTHLLQIAPARQ